ncbi:MAG TPA: TetR/AcrR family transcriptional regulator [Spirochaetes bacterium]|nr:TetR/AcrR family transcriptional regulator [Spirochaetota bacterium]
MKQPRKKTPAGEKERVMMRAAIKVFAGKGYYNSRVSDIAGEADVAHGLFYHYFESKEDILLKIFQNSWKRFVNRIDSIARQPDEPIAKIRQVMEHVFWNYQQFPDLMKVLIMDVPRLNSFYDKKNQSLHGSFFKKVADIIREGKEKGVFKSTVSATVTSHILIGAADSIIRQYVYNPEFSRKKRPFDEVIDQIVMVAVQGLAK